MPEDEDDVLEPLSKEMNQIRSASYRVYLAAGIILLGSFLFIGVLFMPSSPFTRPVFDFESLTWAIGVVVVLVVAFTFERQQTLPSRLDPEIDHVRLALLLRRKQWIVILNYCALSVTTLLVATTIVGWIVVGYEPLRTLFALFFLAVFGACFCEYALSARADARFLEDLEQRRDEQLSTTYASLQEAEDPQIARRVAVGAALALLVALTGWATGAFRWTGVPAIPALAAVPTWAYITGLQADARSKFRRLRRSGRGELRIRHWALRYQAAVIGGLSGLLYPGSVIAVMIATPPTSSLAVGHIVAATLLFWLPVVLGSHSTFQWELAKAARRRQHTIARTTVKRSESHHRSDSNE